MAKKNETKVLDRENYIPFHLISVANQYSRGSSKLFLRLFGVGIIGWRILSFTSLSENMTAQQVCKAVNLDKGATSREIQKLKKLGHIELNTDSKDKRRQLISLTNSGIELHNKMLNVALAREKEFMQHCNVREKQELLRMLKGISNNLTKADHHKYDEFT